MNWWGEHTLSLYFINGGHLFNSVLVLFSGFAAFALIAGYRTRMATVISWFMLISLHQRTGILSSGADDLLRVLAFWAMFLPIGARYSLDAAMDRTSMSAKSPSTALSRETFYSVATFAILMQVMYVYWAGALLKTDNQWTTDFSAVYHALSAEHYASTLGIWFRDTFETQLPLVTAFVFHIELLGPLLLICPLLFIPLRLTTLFLLIGMHSGFLLFLNVGIFPLVSICSLLLFLPKESWNYLASKTERSSSNAHTVFYDEGCDFCLKTVLILKTFLALPRLRVEPAQQDPTAGPMLIEHDSWVIRTEDGEYLLEWRALTWLFSQSPLFFWAKWPMRGLNGIARSGDKFYHAIGNRRQSLGKLSAIVLPWKNSTHSRSENTATTRNKIMHNGLIALPFLLVLHINLAPILPDHLPKITPLEYEIKTVLGLWQKWNMFAPKPVVWTQWPIIEGETANGMKVDIFRQTLGAAPREKPHHILSEYTNYRWRKFYGRLYLKKFNYYRKDYVRFECQKWNQRQKNHNQKIIKISLYMANEKTLNNSAKEKIQIESMGTYRCP